MTKHNFASKWIGVVTWSFFALTYVYFQLSSQQWAVTETFPDSSRYFSPTPILSLENAGIFYSLFVRAFDVFPGISVAQMLYSTAAWLVLSVAVARLFSKWLGLLCGIGTILIASQESVTNWNNLVLSESVAISTCAFWFAALLLVLKPSKDMKTLNIQVWLLLVTSLLLVLNRPQIIIVIFPIALLVSLFVLKSRSSRTWLVLAIGNVVIALLAVVRIMFLAVGSPFASAYAQHLLEQRSQFTSFGLAQADCDPAFATPGIPFSDLVNYCPNIEGLVNENKLSFSSWLISRPLDVVTSFAHWLNHDAFLVNYSSSPTIIERAQANSILGVGFPFITTLGLYVAVGIAMTALSGLLYGFQFSAKRLAAVIVLQALMFSYVMLTWGVDGVEMPRHTLPVLLFIPPVITAGILYVFKQDRLLTFQFPRRTKVNRNS